MAVSYAGLFTLLKERGMKKKDLCKLTGMSYSTLRKMSRGENMQMSVLESVCLELNCRIEEVVKIMPDHDK